MKRRAASWLVLCGVALALYPALAQSPRPAATPPAATDVGLVKRVLGARYDYQLGRWARILADAGLAVFMPNYRGSAGWGLEFAESNIGDMGGADLADILAGIDRLAVGARMWKPVARQSLGASRHLR